MRAKTIPIAESTICQKPSYFQGIEIHSIIRHIQFMFTTLEKHHGMQLKRAYIVQHNIRCFQLLVTQIPDIIRSLLLTRIL